MKKVLIAALVAPMLMAAMPLLASASGNNNSINVSNSGHAWVSNDVNTNAYSGHNVAVKGGLVVSGDAYAGSAVTTAANKAFTAVSSPCGCTTDGTGNNNSVNVSNTGYAGVNNDVNTNAYSGHNVAVKGGEVLGGGATAVSSVSNYLNSSVTLIGGE